MARKPHHISKTRPLTDLDRLTLSVPSAVARAAHARKAGTHAKTASAANRAERRTVRGQLRSGDFDQ
jgi:hypothetical protein